MATIKIEGVLGEKQGDYVEVFYRNYVGGETAKSLQLQVLSDLTLDFERTNYGGKIGELTGINANSISKVMVGGKTMTLAEYADNFASYKPGTVSPGKAYQSLQQ
ncbi:MAG: hypothetical protein U5N85_04335 [Arcicella sp.]|nr:hypothetical protein [Arcicella sp.]